MSNIGVFKDTLGIIDSS
jgi:hypothetical protein